MIVNINIDKKAIALLIIIAMAITGAANTQIGDKIYDALWVNSTVGVNSPNIVANNSPWIDVQAWGAPANGNSNDTAKLEAILASITADTKGNQTIVLVPGFGWWNQTALNPATAVKNGTCVIDLSGNSSKMGGIFVYCDSYNYAGDKDSEYAFASGYHPAFVTVNYGTPSINNVIGSFVNYFWNSSTNSVQTTSQFSSEVDGDSEYGETLYTYTDGAGKTISARNIQRWYYDGGTIIRGGQYGIILQNLTGSEKWAVDALDGNQTTNQVIDTAAPSSKLYDSNSAGAAATGVYQFYDSTGTEMGFIGDSSGTNSDIYVGSIANGVQIYAGGNTRVNVYANGSVQIPALAGVGSRPICANAGGMLVPC